MWLVQTPILDSPDYKNTPAQLDRNYLITKGRAGLNEQQKGRLDAFISLASKTPHSKIAMFPKDIASIMGHQDCVELLTTPMSKKQEALDETINSTTQYRTHVQDRKVEIETSNPIIRNELRK